ncbi:uncharacterized protein LOC129796938 [Lutzomyia longipalpis]|uniref:uncharacterized protein LOC129796938 n=1 Tax=Lutzomyia longipalpis TaxID=7200 RepID=UPI0024837ED2|nr:uncharacterized protein LOC129796938 [Lutzomyia longipalpis]
MLPKTKTMEEFLKLNWSKKYPKHLRYGKDVYSCGFSDDEEDVYVCHLNEINPEFYGRTHKPQQHAEKQEIRTTDSLTNSQNARDEGGLHLFRKFPNRSKIPRNIHMSCLRYLRKIEDLHGDGDLSPELNSDGKNYLSSEAMRKAEKQEFCEFVKNYFMTYLSHRFLKIDVGMEDILIEQWKKSIQDVKKRKDQNYQLQTALGLDYRLPGDEEVSFVHEKEVYRTGNVSKINCSFSSTEMLSLEQNSEQLRAYLGDNGDKNSRRKDETTRIVRDLAEENSIDFILPLEAIEMMVNGMKISWNVPFRIEDTGKRTLGIIDKPLPPLSINTKQRNAEIFKYCLEMKILDPQTVSSLEKLEKYPIYSDSEDEMQLVIDESQTDTNAEVTQDAKKLPSHTAAPEKTWQRARNNSFHKCILRSDDDQCSILVDTYQDGADSMDNVINLSIKIEHQTEFGAEEMTHEELIHEWCLQMFNPQSKTLRIRIDSQTLQILSVKEVSLKRIERDLERLHKISTQELLQKLWGLLSMMKNFPTQNYLMHHDVVHDKKLMIYVSRECGMPDRNFLQLSQLYEGIDFKRKPLLEQHEWIPIDDQEVTLFHEREKVMPCAFPHWGKQPGSAGMWNEKKALKAKFEARLKKKIEMQQAIEKRKKSEKNRKKKEKRRQTQMLKKHQKATEKTEKFGKMLAKSGDTTAPEWFFDEDGRVRLHTSPGTSQETFPTQ